MASRANYQKLRGGYYTPEAISSFLARWAIQTPDDEVLEPSCGDGNILMAAANTLLSLGASPNSIAEQLHGVELDLDEAKKAIGRLLAIGIPASIPGTVHVGDFFAHCQQSLFGQDVISLVTQQRRRFDVVIGNPPFIRYQSFPDEHRVLAFEMMRVAGMNPTRLANTWLPFLVISSLLLKDSGRLAMIIPAELFQVNYAAEVRQFLSDFFKRVTLVTFKQLLFADIQQEVVLLLAERNNLDQTGIRSIEVANSDDLRNLDSDRLKSIQLKPMDHSREKWTQYFLDISEINLLRELRDHPKITRANRVLDVDVGVVTGQNAFFVMTKSEVRARCVEPFLERLVSRSSHLRGTIFSAQDWQDNVDDDLPSFLFTPPDVPIDELGQSLQEYIAFGEAQKIHEGYKCRIRNRWYILPSVWAPDAFMLRQVHSHPKLTLNTSTAVCTDTIHRVRFRGGADGKAVTAAFLNSLTFAFSEVTGRSYGGGVLTFEPSEMESLPLPLIGSEQLDLEVLDQLLRKGEIDKVLQINDEILLIKGLNLSWNEVQALRGIWMKMRDRRIGRK